MAITDRQDLFCKEWIVDMNATRAAIAAGYSARTACAIASRLMSKPEIKERIAELMAEKDDELIAKQDEVLKYLTSVMRREKKENIVVTVSQSEEKWLPDENGTMRKQKITTTEPKVVEIPSKLVDANKAAELLGRRYGLFIDKQEVSGIAQVSIVDDIPDEE